MSVQSALPAEITQLLCSLKQGNDNRAWSLAEDVVLAEQVSKSIAYANIHIEGRPGERTAERRIDALTKLLPGIVMALHKVGAVASANESCEAEKAYMDRSLSGAVTRALSGIDRSTPQPSSMWSLREDTLLLNKFLCDTDYCKELRIPGHDGEHAARRRLEQLRLLSSEIADAVPIRIRSHQHAKARDHNAAAWER